MLKKIPCLLLILVVFTFSPQISLLIANDQAVLSSSKKPTHLSILSTITNLAQTAIWLNEEELAVGRWDGTITIFHCENTPSILQALVPPKKQGITMLEKINNYSFVSSNGSTSIALWERSYPGYFLKSIHNFSDLFGPADSAKFIEIGDQQMLVTGHSEGYILIWKFSNESLSPLFFINLQSDHPIESPYKLWNIRSILSWKEGIIITASEDGDLCMVDIVKGKVVYRQQYNKNAKRGINHIFLSGNYLLLSNCSVGFSDRNLWLYQIEENQFIYLDSKNLVANKNLEQVFSFNVGCIPDGDDIHFFCSTEEGLLWFGRIENESLCISSFKKISYRGGAALAIHPLKKLLASVSYDIHLLELSNE